MASCNDGMQYAVAALPTRTPDSQDASQIEISVASTPAETQIEIEDASSGNGDRHSTGRHDFEVVEEILQKFTSDGEVEQGFLPQPDAEHGAEHSITDIPYNQRRLSDEYIAKEDDSFTPKLQRFPSSDSDMSEEPIFVHGRPDGPDRFRGAELEHHLVELTGQYTVVAEREPSQIRAETATEKDHGPPRSVSFMRTGQHEKNDGPKRSVSFMQMGHQEKNDGPQRSVRPFPMGEQSQADSLITRARESDRRTSLHQTYQQSASIRNRLSTALVSPHRGHRKRASDSYTATRKSTHIHIDHDDYETMNVTSHVGLYLRSGWVIGLTLLDFLTLLVLQVFWAPEDFACRKTKGGNVHAANLAILIIIIVFHFGYLIVHMVRVMCGWNNCSRLKMELRTRLQRAVSSTRRRFVDKDVNLDLDLTYIANRLIAMSLPCVDHALYRNDIRDVARFFASRHYGSFAVVNLCEKFEEAGNGNYDVGLLYGQVQKFPQHDHNAPELKMLVAFCEAAVTFLNKRPSNVLAVHCQGGKGRTGTYCCSLMLWTGFFLSAHEALDYFAKRRTEKAEGSNEEEQRVVSPAQIRYVHYIQDVIYAGVDIDKANPLLMTGMTLFTAPYTDDTALAVIVEVGPNVIYDHCEARGPVRTSWDLPSQIYQIDFGCLLVDGDVTIRLYALEDVADDLALLGADAELVNAARGIRYGKIKGKCMMFVTFHTAFHTGDMTFTKQDIDGGHKDEAHRQFHPDLRIDVQMSTGSFNSNRDSKGAAGAKSHLLLLQNSLSLRSDYTPFYLSHLPIVSPVRQEINPTSSSPTSNTTYRQSLHRIQLLVEFHRVMALCPTRAYRKGELVYGPCDDSSGRVLHMILDGRVSCEQQDRSKFPGAGALGVAPDASVQTLGAGKLVGWEDLLFGEKGTGTVYAFEAQSKIVKIQSLPLSNAPCPPLNFTLSSLILQPGDLLVVFEFIATFLAAESRSLAHQLVTVTERRQAKRAMLSGDGVTDKAKLFKRVAEAHSLPTTEQVLCSTTASWVEGRKAEGHLMLFNQWLIFSPLIAHGSRDLVIPLEMIRSATIKKNAIIIHQAVIEAGHRSHSPPSNERTSYPISGSKNTGKMLTKNAGKWSSFNLNITRSRSNSDIEKPINDLSAAEATLGFFSHNPRKQSESDDQAERPDNTKTFREARRHAKQERRQHELERSDKGNTFFLSSVPHARSIHQQILKHLAQKEEQTQESGSPELAIQRRFVFVLDGERVREDESEALRTLLSPENQETSSPLLITAAPFSGASLVRNPVHTVAAGESLREVDTVSGDVWVSWVSAGKSSQLRVACRYKQGEVILERGDQIRSIFLILKGSVVQKSTKDSVLEVHHDGEIVGWGSFFALGNRGFVTRYVAGSDVEVLRINYRTLENAISASPLVGARFWRSLAMFLGRRVQRQQQRLFDVEETTVDRVLESFHSFNERSVQSRKDKDK